MYKRILSVIIAVLMIMTMMPLSQDAYAAESFNLTVIGSSDVHGGITGWSYDRGEDYYKNSGLARIATIVKEARKENPNTLLIDNGDTVQGNVLTDDIYNQDLSLENPMMAVMNAMKYDAMLLGNHEFNFGTDVIDKIIKEADFPVIAGNIYKKADGKNYVEPYLVKSFGDVKVGVLGLTVTDVPKYDSTKKGVMDLEFKPLVDEAKKWIKVLKETEKVDVIIVSAHAGLDDRYASEEEKGYGPSAAKMIAEQCPEVNALLIGHDHDSISTEINGIKVLAPKQDREVARFDITLEKQNGAWTVKGTDSKIISLKGVAEDAETLEAAKPFHEKALDFVQGTIGTATDDFHPAAEIYNIPEAQIRDTAVIDFINKVQLEVTGSDISAAALFNAKSNLKKGDLSYMDVFSVYSYSNALVTVKVTGAELKSYMEQSAEFYNQYKEGDLTISFNPDIRGYAYDMFAGVNYKIDISKPVGERIVDLTFDGKPVTDDQTFTLAINDYRYSKLGQEGNKTFANEPLTNTFPVSLRMLLKEYIEKKGTISPEVDNNWEIIGNDWDETKRAEIVKAVKDRKLSVAQYNPTTLTVEDLKSVGVSVDLPEDSTNIAIVHTNDTHGRLLYDDYNGTMGFAKIGAKVEELRSLLNNNVVVLDAGDSLHGLPVATISKGKAVIDVFNTIGYDAMTFGNHDYNYGYARGLELQKEMKYPVLIANVVDANGKAVYTPSTIKEVGGVKIGIFGLTTPETAYKSHPKNTQGLTIQDPVEVAKKMVAELEGKVDVIVALTHLGYQEGDYSSDKLAKAVDGIDLIVDGHSHTLLEKGALVNDTMIVQANEYGKYLGVIYLSIAKDGKVSITPTLISAESMVNYSDNKEVSDLLKDIEKTNEELTADVCGKTDVELVGERNVVRKGESNLGNLLTTAMLSASGADIAFTNGGGIRASIPVGEINKGHIIEVLPFGNQLVSIKVKGENIVKALEFGVSKYPEANGGFPHVAGITFKFDPEQPVGSRVYDVMVGGQPIDLAKTYKVATNDFLAAGGDGYTMLTDTDPNEYDALDEVLFDHIKVNGLGDAVADGRVSVGTKTTTEPTKPVEPIEPTKPVEPTEPTEEITYIVVAGDVLWRIAQKYNTTYQELAKYNNIANPHLIFVDQVIKIPVKK